MIQLLNGNCLDEMKKMEDNSVDSIVTDPPYGLSFMGKKWDYDVPSEDIWRECLRVLKPGGHLLAFAGTRTQHRMAVRIEDAGFEIRDMIAWVYGSGFPKSLNIGKSIDAKLTTGSAAKNGFHKLEGERREGRIGMYDTVEEHGFRKHNPDQLGAFDHEPTTEEAKQWGGWGTALKPALEPITVARKPLIGTVAENVLTHGTGGINIDGCRVGTDEDMSSLKAFGSMPKNKTDGQGFSRPWMNDKQSILDKQNAAIDKMKNMGRFPANLIHDGSEEVVGLFPLNVKGEIGRAGRKSAGNYEASNYKVGVVTETGFKDSGSAARFFYCAKASKKDRDEGLEGFEVKRTAAMAGNMVEGQRLAGNGTPIATPIRANHHPTVKPTDLMRYLCRLVTPKGGTILDPFMGSGSTGKGAVKEGFNFIGIELDEEYVKIAEKRIADVV